MNHLEIVTGAIKESRRHIYLGVQVLVDGVAIADFRHYATSPSALQESAARDGEHVIVTCWCGDAGCAGLEAGVRVARGAGSVTWSLPTSLGAKRFVFEEKQYRTAIEEGLRGARQRFAEVSRSTAKTVHTLPFLEEDFFKDNS